MSDGVIKGFWFAWERSNTGVVPVIHHDGINSTDEKKTMARYPITPDETYLGLATLMEKYPPPKVQEET